MPTNAPKLSRWPEENQNPPSSSDNTRLPDQEDLSFEDTFVLFAVLQEVANELRSIKHGKKHSTARRSDEADLQSR